FACATPRSETGSDRSTMPSAGCTRSRTRGPGAGPRRCARHSGGSRGVMMRDTGGVTLVLAEYGRAHEQDALAILTATIDRLFPAASLRTVVVDNASPDGDNSIHE